MDAGRLVCGASGVRPADKKQRSVPALCKTVSCEQCKNWPKSVAIGARGEALTQAELLSQEIVPCFPKIDIGFDLVASYRHVLKRVQVKATESMLAVTPTSVTFCLSRQKAGHMRGGVYTKTPSKAYDHADVDVFVFVHNLLRLFYVVPSSEIDLTKHKISFRQNTRWRNAWDVFKTV